MRRHEILMSLRGAAPVLEFGKEEGIVVFRSFHTTLAIITTYAARGVGRDDGQRGMEGPENDDPFLFAELQHRCRTSQ